MDDIVPSSERAILNDADSPASPVTDAPSARDGENGTSARSSASTEDGSSLVTTPATKRKPRARKTTKKKKVEPPPIETTVPVPSAPLTRPDGTPAPVVHLAG